jgi:hypothetical protein
MPTYNLKELVPARSLPLTASAIYNVPSATTSVIKQIIVGNTTATDLTATIYFVPSGGSPTVSNSMFPEIIISSNTSVTIDISSVLTANSSIFAKASASASVNIHVSGVEVI